jgi:quinol---cytochrome c reductase cytochrome c subunit, bacillus type
VTAVPSDRIQERQRYFQQYKEDVKTRGKKFFPYAMLHDTIMSLVVVVVIIGLSVVWKFSIPGGENEGTESGWLGKLYDEPADPGTVSFIPRPDWYFYFLFYLLRIFKWPESVILGTVGVPTLCVLLLIALPFMDTRAERRPRFRPVAMVAGVLVILSMGILTWKGATAKESLGSELVLQVPRWAEEQGFEDNPAALAGAKLFAESGCTNCHTYLGDGTTNLGAPDLSSIGAGGQGAEFFAKYVANPADFNNNVMPPYGKQYGGALTAKQLLQVGEFLNASKGS